MTLYDTNDGTLKVREAPLSGVYTGETATAAIPGAVGTRLKEVHDVFYLYAKLPVAPDEDYMLSLPRLEIGGGIKGVGGGIKGVGDN